MRKKKLLDKKWSIEKTYDELIETVYTLLNKPVEAPELDKIKLVN